MRTTNDIVLKLLGLLLLTGAILKGWQLLTEPLANDDIFSYRPFLILTVEFELALAVWLFSGLFKRAAWIICLLCFSLFSLVSLYKALSGAESCGCFGSVHVTFKTNCHLGRLAEIKEWFITTPATALITDGKVKKAWEEKTPDFQTILENIVSTKHLMSSLHTKGGDA